MQVQQLDISNLKLSKNAAQTICLLTALWLVISNAVSSYHSIGVVSRGSDKFFATNFLHVLRRVEIHGIV